MDGADHSQLALVLGAIGVFVSVLSAAGSGALAFAFHRTGHGAGWVVISALFAPLFLLNLGVPLVVQTLGPPQMQTLIWANALAAIVPSFFTVLVIVFCVKPWPKAPGALDADSL